MQDGHPKPPMLIKHEVIGLHGRPHLAECQGVTLNVLLANRAKVVYPGLTLPSLHLSQRTLAAIATTHHCCELTLQNLDVQEWVIPFLMQRAPFP